jgi:subtilisin family serine protease
MQTPSSYLGRLPAKPLIFGLLLLLLWAISILFAPRSAANRAQRSQAQGISSEKRRRPVFVPGEVLVRFKQGRAFEGAAMIAVPNNDVSSLAQKSGARQPAMSSEEIPVNLDRFAGSDLVEGLRLARTQPGDTMKAIAAFRSRDDVVYAEPNYTIYLDRTPVDTSYTQLWALKNTGQQVVPPTMGTPGDDIKAEQAWDITTGNRNIVVGVIDEGIDVVHPDLQANIWTNPSPGSIAGITGDLHGYDFRDDTGTIIAESHATHVAGIIGAVGDNHEGVVGVNWLVNLMSLRFISQATDSGSEADAIRAYSYAKQMRDLWVGPNPTKGANIRVLNASYGGGGYSQASADALNALGQSGILFVAAAGNEHVANSPDSGNNDITPHYPSGYSLPNVMSVAATDQNDGLATFSNFGSRTVLLGAPGVNILSTTPAPNSYTIMNGTSMATPYVAGAAALLCAANPNLTVNQLRALLSFNGDVVPGLQGKTLSGRRLNVFKSLQAMNEGDTTAPGTVGAFQISSQSGRTLNLSWTASGDDGAAGQASLYDISFVDQATNAVVPLTTLAPAPSGTVQSLTVNLPYRHLSGTIRLREFDNVGNEGTPASVPVSVPPNFADPYTTALSAHTALSTGGTPLGLTFDDRYRENFPLPFTFSFFGQLYNAVTISTNGNLYFSPPPKRVPSGDADDVPSSVSDLSQFKMIAGMWDDLDLSDRGIPGADVYVFQPDATHIIFRWKGVQFGDGTPINFEIELRADGVVTTRYGDGNVNLLPVVGVSGGAPDPYVIDSLTSELTPKTLTNAQNVVFTPRATVQFSNPTYTVNENAAHADIVVTRSGDATSAASVSFTTNDTAGSQPCNQANAKASSRCDYTTTFGTVQFAAGDVSKTFSIPIVDDSFMEGDETFTVSLSNGFGTSLGAQTNATVTIKDNETNSNGPNPFDTTAFFVRQHYLDFLNREPDTAGLNFWINNIDGCSPKPSCLDIQRVNTSAAFFLSIEFQDTGYLVERIYKAAYGSATGTSTLGESPTLPVPIVRFSEFLPDTQEIGQGVVVGQGNWQQQLDLNKQAFTAEFVLRSRFVAAFPTSLTPALFVDTLNTNAGNPLSLSERNQLVTDLTANVKTRAQVLRAVAEDVDLSTAEFNRAFVLMQYFGYLRRDPNNGNGDIDYTGYDFWLGKLNSFTVPGDDPLIRVQKADMVKAFITSAEYRQRVGP